MAGESLGRAYVEIVPDTKGFGSDVEKQLGKEIGPAADAVNDKIGSGMAGAFKKLGTAVAAAGVGAFLKSTISAAGGLNEQISKTGVVFGDGADAVLEFGKNAAQSIGASEAEALTAAGTFGNLLRSVGLSSEAAASMSINMVQLAGDLASFNNVPIGEALDAIRSGLVGETEPLKRFGVNLNEATLKAEAMRLGFDTTGATLGAAEKAQASYSLIMKQTTLAQGDFARTSESLANQQRILSAEFSNAKADIGQALLPAMLAVVQAGQDLIPVLTSTASGFGTLISSVAPLVGFLGQIAGSDVGGQLIVVGLGATAAYIAFDKLWKAAQVAQKAIAAASTTFTTTNVVLAGIGFTLGIAAAAYTAYKSNQEEAARSQEAFNKAVLASGDPLAKLGDQYERLSTMSVALQTSTGQVAESLDDVVDVALTKRLNDNVDVLTTLGITFADVKKAVLEGGSALKDLDGKLFAAASSGVTLRGSTANLREDLSLTRKEIDKNRDSIAGQITQGLNWLVLNGKLSAEELQKARNATGTNDKTEQAIILGEKYAGTLQREATAAGGLAPPLNAAADATGNIIQAQTAQEKQATALEAASKRVADAEVKKSDAIADVAEKYNLGWDAAERYVAASDAEKDATNEQKEAKDELTRAIEEAQAAQESYLFTISGAAVTADQVTLAARDMAKTLIEGADAAGRGTVAFTGNTDAAIANRAAMDDVLQAATKTINGYDDLGYSSDKAAEAQKQLATDFYNAAIGANATEEEARAVEAAILAIPPEKKTTIEAEARVKAAEAELQRLERERTAIINAEVRLDFSGLTREQHALIGIAGAAHGAYVPHQPGGQIMRVGEGGQDEAIVPLGANFAADLARIVGPKNMAKFGTGGTTIGPVNVSIANAPGSAAEARHLGRIVGETAADVLAQRQLAMAVRVS